RRFSHNYVRELIESSPVKKLFMGSRSTNSVLQREFRNRSKMIFSHAFMDASRTRGVPSDVAVIDEFQGMMNEFIPIILSSLDGSEHFGVSMFSGTPLTMDCPMEVYWKQSSQAEWVVKCHHGGCGYWNVPTISRDLKQMIGREWRTVCEQTPGVVCAK